MQALRVSSHSDAYPSKLGLALSKMGDYVYAYYRPDEFRPFYVGKGKGSRVLTHWKEAIRPNADKKAQEREILSILKSGNLPVIKLLAYNLERTEKSAVYSTVERVLQDAFGIQTVYEKINGGSHKVEHEAVLLQKREDSARTPVLSLEAVLAKADVRKTVSLQELSDMVGSPILMVGISKTYHPSYPAKLVSEMARKYWELDRFANTSLQRYRTSGAPVLLAWSSLVNKAPMVVGAWRVEPGSVRRARGISRYEMQVEVQDDLALRKTCLGLRLRGTGNSWQGQHFAFPSV